MTKSTTRRLSRLLIAASAAAITLSGCALLEGPTPETPPREQPAAPESEPLFVPGGSAAENLPFFRHVLDGYAAGDGSITGRPIVTALTEAGFDRTMMQVSFDRTETDLEADNIFVSVRVGTDCLIGQVVAEDRSVVAETAPAVGPDATLCLIGETAPIDW